MLPLLKNSLIGRSPLLANSSLYSNTSKFLLGLVKTCSLQEEDINDIYIKDDSIWIDFWNAFTTVCENLVCESFEDTIEVYVILNYQLDGFLNGNY